MNPLYILTPCLFICFNIIILSVLWSRYNDLVHNDMLVFTLHVLATRYGACYAVRSIFHISKTATATLIYFTCSLLSNQVWNTFLGSFVQQWKDIEERKLL